MIELIHYYYLVFGALTVVGGFLGYVKANSTASLSAGAFTGLWLIISGVDVRPQVGADIAAGRSDILGLCLGLLTSLALALRFVPAFLQKRLLMPTGVMSILSVSVINITLSLAAFFLP